MDDLDGAVPISTEHIPLRLRPTASPKSAVDSPDDGPPATVRVNRNLWEEAFAKLDDVQRDLLSKIEQPRGPEIIVTLAKQTEEKYIEHQQRGWKISRGQGKPGINLRAVFQKSLSSVLKFKGLIDAGVAFDPTGHASSAWAIVSLGLQMVQNNVDMLKSVFETCGALAETLTRYAAIEAGYRDRTVPDSTHLEDSIVGVYVAILELSAEIVHENRSNLGQRILKSITSLSEQPLQDFIKSLNSKEEMSKKWTDIIQHQYRRREMEEIDQKVDSTIAGIERLAQQLSDVASRTLTAEENDILDWLSNYDFSESYNTAKLKREPGTGWWVLNSLQYKTWKESGDKMLWLYGSCKQSPILGEPVLKDSQLDVERVSYGNHVPSGRVKLSH